MILVGCAQSGIKEGLGLFCTSAFLVLFRMISFLFNNVIQSRERNTEHSIQSYIINLSITTLILNFVSYINSFVTYSIFLFFFHLESYIHIYIYIMFLRLFLLLCILTFYSQEAILISKEVNFFL